MGLTIKYLRITKSGRYASNVKYGILAIDILMSGKEKNSLSTVPKRRKKK
jgi:hypothetical protein